MVDTTTRIKDTGLDIEGNASFTAYASGAWIEFPSNNFIFEGNIGDEGKAGFVKEDDSTLDYFKNDTTILHPPRITMRGIIANADSTKLAQLWALRKSRGVKRLTGGINVISAIKDGTDTHDYINVIITNVTFTENYVGDNTNVSYTVQFKQV